MFIKVDLDTYPTKAMNTLADVREELEDGLAKLTAAAEATANGFTRKAQAVAALEELAADKDRRLSTIPDTISLAKLREMYIAGILAAARETEEMSNLKQLVHADRTLERKLNAIIEHAEEAHAAFTAKAAEGTNALARHVEGKGDSYLIAVEGASFASEIGEAVAANHERGHDLRECTERYISQLTGPLLSFPRNIRHNGLGGASHRRGMCRAVAAEQVLDQIRYAYGNLAVAPMLIDVGEL